MRVAITDYSFPDLAIEESILHPAGHEIIAGKTNARRQSCRS